jgi:hypothetical protein
MTGNVGRGRDTKARGKSSKSRTSKAKNTKESKSRKFDCSNQANVSDEEYHCEQEYEQNSLGVPKQLSCSRSLSIRPTKIAFDSRVGTFDSKEHTPIPDEGCITFNKRPWNDFKDCFLLDNKKNIPKRVYTSGTRKSVEVLLCSGC